MTTRDTIASLGAELDAAELKAKPDGPIGRPWADVLRKWIRQGVMSTQWRAFGYARPFESHIHALLDAAVIRRQEDWRMMANGGPMPRNPRDTRAELRAEVRRLKRKANQLRTRLEVLRGAGVEAASEWVNQVMDRDDEIARLRARLYRAIGDGEGWECGHGIELDAVCHDCDAERLAQELNSRNAHGRGSLRNASSAHDRRSSAIALWCVRGGEVPRRVWSEHERERHGEEHLRR